MTFDINEQLKSSITKTFLKVIPTAQFQHVVMHLGMRKEDAALVVDSNGCLLGIFLESDIPKHLVERTPRKTPISRLMQDNVYSVEINDDLLRFAEVMLRENLPLMPVTRNGFVVGVLKRDSVSKILFESYKNEAELRRNLQKQLEFKEDYLSIVSHDIQTPLHVINLSCDFLSAHGQDFTEDQKNFIERIHRNSDNAMNVVENVLKHARVESGFSLNMETVSIDEIMTEISGALQAIAAARLCRLSIRCEQCFKIELDKSRMFHVLQNLVANITHYAKEGSTISVEVSTIKVDKEDALQIKVFDQLLNIADVIKEIESNRAEEQETIVKTFGLGIGLAVVKKFVQLHNGDIKIEVNDDKNSYVEVTIPGVKLITSGKINDPSKVKILLVEDDDDIRTYFSEEFEMAGFEVIEARNGEEGINCFYRYRPDLVFSDIIMPVKDGFELMAEVKAENPDCPFILCSGYYPNLHVDMEKSAYKADLFINKPISGIKLMELVETISDNVNVAA